MAGRSPDSIDQMDFMASHPRTIDRVNATMTEVAGATTLPILMLGGDPGPDAERTFGRWDQAMREPNVRGLVAGRALLYPHDREPEDAVRHAADIVHGPTSSGDDS